ncbi:hypothetical protein [Streptomyces sp. TRM68367]|uniref:hypothetical protein n=1 Tax=Streptomyces sp. TRM68367 TaxID=2758415 RepID=UPI00165BFF50|nr:hypothetical protein [Streptomyces sp. TRM68367]MBC9730744.1 hypothetical protein [Streptomyces sp. TRM68367]
MGAGTVWHCQVRGAYYVASGQALGLGGDGMRTARSRRLPGSGARNAVQVDVGAGHPVRFGDQQAEFLLPQVDVDGVPDTADSAAAIRSRASAGTAWTTRRQRGSASWTASVRARRLIAM